MRDSHPERIHCFQARTAAATGLVFPSAHFEGQNTRETLGGHGSACAAVASYRLTPDLHRTMIFSYDNFIV